MICFLLVFLPLPLSPLITFSTQQLKRYYENVKSCVTLQLRALQWLSIQLRAKAKFLTARLELPSSAPITFLNNSLTNSPLAYPSLATPGCLLRLKHTIWSISAAVAKIPRSRRLKSDVYISQLWRRGSPRPERR